MRILIADDNALIRRALHQVLEQQEGWKVCSEAQDGLEAVEQAKRFKPDFVLLDLAMPHMSGLQAAARIAGLLPNTPMVMLTLYDSPLVRAEARNVGILQVIPKTDGQSLVATINAVLRKVRVLNVKATKGLPATKIKPTSL